MPFVTDLVGRATGRAHWVLERALIYDYGDVTITVPAGFGSDMASIPAVLQPFLPVNDLHRAASVLHDYLYYSQPVSRALADAIFRTAMRESGVGWLKRWSMWVGVRAGGWLAWRRAQL